MNFHYSLFYSISAEILHLIKVAWSPRLRSKLHMGTDNSEDHQYFDVNHQHFYVNHRHFHVHHQHFHVNQLPQTSKITRRTCERALQDGFRLFLGGGINPAVQPVDWSFPPPPQELWWRGNGVCKTLTLTVWGRSRCRERPQLRVGLPDSARLPVGGQRLPSWSD